MRYAIALPLSYIPSPLENVLLYSSLIKIHAAIEDWVETGVAKTAPREKGVLEPTP